MSISIVQMSNGDMVGWSALEIQAIPFVGTLGENQTEVLNRRDSLFADLMRTVAGFGIVQNTFVELLYVGQPVYGQVYSACPRLYIIFRRAGSNEAEIRHCLDSLIGSWQSSMSAFGYTVAATGVDFISQLKSINTQTVISVEKKPGMAMIPGQMMYVCYVNETRLNAPSNLSPLYEAISRTPGAAVSIQLTPTGITETEKQFIDGVSYYLDILNRQGRHCNGESCYYTLQNLKNDICYLGNILIFGTRGDAALISGIISGILRGEDGQTAIIEKDRTRQVTPLSTGFAAWPWNYLMTILSSRNPDQNVLLQFRRLVHLFSASEIRTFFHLPVDDGNVPGVSVNRTSVINDTFEQGVINGGDIRLGQLLSTSGRKAMIGTGLANFSRHALIVGMPGTGKTTFSVNILLQFYKCNPSIPFLAIEPTKTEYRAMIDAIPDLQVFTPGRNDVVPFIINPFLPPEGITLEVFKPSLLSAFKAAFSMPNPLDILFAKAIDVCYTEHGWRPYTKVNDPEATPFGLQEFIRSFKTVIRSSEYSGETKGNMESAGVFRLTDLITKNSNIYDTEKGIPLSDLLKKPTVIELNAIGDREQKALIMALLLINIVLYTKHNQAGDGRLKNILLIDEAHVLLGNQATVTSENSATAGASTVQAIQDMILEIRSYGTGIIIADQSPEKVTHEVVGNTDIKVVFRLEDIKDRQLIRNNTNMSDADEHNLAILNTGEAYVYFRGLKTPVCIMTDDIRQQEGIRLVVSNQELRSRVDYWRTKQDLLKPYHECDLCSICQTCNLRLRDDAKYYAEKLFAEDKSGIKDKSSLAKHIPLVYKHITEEESGYHGEAFRQLVYCCCIRYIRKAMLETSFSLNPTEVKKALDYTMRKFAGEETNVKKSEKYSADNRGEGQ